MPRFILVALMTLVSAAPAFAHEGAGIVHFLTQSDHVIGLILLVAVAALFAIVLRYKRPASQRRRVRKD